MLFAPARKLTAAAAPAQATKMGQVKPVDNDNDSERDAVKKPVLVPAGRERPLRTRSQVTFTVTSQ
jgi:hypothetical protein